MYNESGASAAAGVLIFAAVWALIAIGVFVWYLWAMSRLFPRIGLKSCEGWIPVWNQWKLLERAGLPGWVILFAFVGLGIVPAIMLIIAMHRINTQYGAGAGYTVLGVFIAPLWAMLLANHIDKSGIRPAAPRPGHAPVPGANGTETGTVPPAPAGYAPSPAAGYAPPPAAAPAAPAAFAAPVAPASATPKAAPWAAAEGAGAASGAVPPAAAPPAPTAAPAPAAPPAPAAAPAPGGAFPSGPLGGDTEAEYLRLVAEGFQAPPAAPLGQHQAPPPFSWTAASRPETPPPAAPAPPVPPVHPLAAPASEQAPPPAPAGTQLPPLVAPAAAAPPTQPVPPAPPAPPVSSSPPAAPPAPVQAAPQYAPRPADAPQSAAQVAPPVEMPVNQPLPHTVSAPVIPPAAASGQGSPFTQEGFAPDEKVVSTPAPASYKATGITGRVVPLVGDETIVTGSEPEADDLDRTIVVPRKPSFNWVLELPDGSELRLEAHTIVGRRPESIDGGFALAIPDTTRTLSKNHARLSFSDGTWTVEDLGSTNGLVLIADDGSESELTPFVPTPATARMLIGTLEVKLRPGGDAA